MQTDIRFGSFASIAIESRPIPPKPGSHFWRFVSPRRMYRPFFVPTRTATFFAMTPSLSARECRDHVHDVAFLERSALPPQQAGVVLVDEERHVRSQFAVFVAEALGQ